MVEHVLRMLVAASVLAGALSCLDGDSDDRFARDFIAALHASDSAALAQLDPASEIARVPGDRLLQQARRLLPVGMLDSIVRQEWEMARGANGANRKLTYGVFGGGSISQVELWIVTVRGRPAVNSLRVTGPVAAGSAK